MANVRSDGKGDCKGTEHLHFVTSQLIRVVGDFGLATSSLAAVDPSDVTAIVSHDADMTLGKSSVT